MSLFAFGNRKLPKSIAIFNLPRLITCPQPTELCRKICYAQKAERRFFKNTVRSRMKNYNLSLRHDFSGTVIKDLEKIKQRVIRLHESGDFYSQYYFDKWVDIMRYFGSEKTFYVYTKSKLDYSRKPSNMILFFSIDRTTDATNFMWYTNNPYKDALTFIDETGLAINCVGDCKICDKCYNKEKVVDVFFRRH